MSLNKILVLPIYYGIDFAHRMITTARHSLKYNREVQDEVYDNKYMMMVTFGNRNERNPQLLPSLSLTRAKISITVHSEKNEQSDQSDQTGQSGQNDRDIITLTSGYAKGQTVLYDYFSSPSPLDLTSIQVSTNADLYVEWIVICPIDVPDSDSRDTVKETNRDNLYPIFDSVPASPDGQPVTIQRYATDTKALQALSKAFSKASVVAGTTVNNKYQILARSNGDQHPHTLDAPWYEYNASGYFDNIRYVFHHYGNKLTRALVSPFWPYKQQIYNGLPVPYSSVADYEIMFGKTMTSVWNVGDCSLVPYKGVKYLDLIDTSLHDSLYICDMTKFKTVKAERSPNYNSDLYWGIVILAYQDGYLRPVLVDHPSDHDCDDDDTSDHDCDDDDTSDHDCDDDDTSDHDHGHSGTIYTPKDGDWLLGLRKYYNTHETLLFFFHITFIHEFCEYLSLVFKRNMPPSHPLYHLYSPFSNQEISSGMLNRNAINFIFPAFTRDTYEQIITTLYVGFTYNDMMFDKYLKDYGFTDHHFKQLPQIQRMLSLWRMASGYVNKYVDAVYSEFDISQDCYVKQWFQELNSGTYKGFAGHLEDVTLEKVKQVFTIHIFQSLVHWSDHNITLNYLSGVDSTLGYDKSSQGRATSSDKMLSNYILLIANTSKLMGDKDNYPKLMDIGYIPFLENHALMSNLTSLKHELVDFEAHELKVNNYRDALLLSDMYQGATY